MNSFESAVADRLKIKMDEAAVSRMQDMATGSCAVGDVASTGAAYMKMVGYFLALNDVAAMLAEVERDLLGRTRE